MDVIKFTLEGRFAFFKKPDVNTYLYFTYGNIHKVALLGMFGAILGYKGYNQMSFSKKYKNDFKGLLEDNEGYYPEFYEKLNYLKIGITPKEVHINKKVQIFNNSVGYASKEQGGNLIVKEQWLEKPSWDIYIAIEDEEGKKLAKALIDRSFVYIPYLGKNDHLADIKNIEFIKDVKEINSLSMINSLFRKDDFEIVENDDFDDFDEEDVLIFKYEEKLPMSLEKMTNKYELESFVYTNANLKKKGSTSVYSICGKNIVFI
ncbi:type I-B CRISPR-associated protein Cas5b [Anaerophilus nitritogenes]|uniref:type I-B CRISPR-associated protein Cas5b n=1 Tax=Anaerophilus nitritogenes TaxID=2498136 RepID=UPI00101CFD3C|nr:type I-B CRISPR-associated protein Cas5b [Anaerophilus nitritogenes]